MCNRLREEWESLSYWETQRSEKYGQLSAREPFVLLATDIASCSKQRRTYPPPHNKDEPLNYCIYHMRILGMLLFISVKTENHNNRFSYLRNSSFYLHNHRTRSGWLGPMSPLGQCCRKANGTSALWSSSLIPGSISPTLYPVLGREQAFVSKICNSSGGRSISTNVYPMLHGEIKENMSANWEQVGLHKEVRTEKLDFVLIKPSNKTIIVKNTHV